MTIRPWYVAVKAAKTPMWSTLGTFASSSATVKYVGFTWGVPFYKKQKGKSVLVGVVAADINVNTFFQPIVDGYKEDGVQAYIVETSSFNLIVTTTGEGCFNYNTQQIKKATASLDAATAESASYLTSSNTAWKADGDYLLAIGGFDYNVNLKSYSDATGTANWKIVVVGARSSLAVPTADYVQTVQEAMAATKASINNIWSIVQAIPPLIVFQHGVSDQQPLSTPLMTYNTPAIQSLTQQVMWATSSSFNKNVGTMIVSYLYEI